MKHLLIVLGIAIPMLGAIAFGLATAHEREAGTVSPILAILFVCGFGVAMLFLNVKK